MLPHGNVSQVRGRMLRRMQLRGAEPDLHCHGGTAISCCICMRLHLSRGWSRIAQQCHAMNPTGMSWFATTLQAMMCLYVEEAAEFDKLSNI